MRLRWWKRSPPSQKSKHMQIWLSSTKLWCSLTKNGCSICCKIKSSVLARSICSFWISAATFWTFIAYI